jgi:long-chain fatty acid transport protein
MRIRYRLWKSAMIMAALVTEKTPNIEVLMARLLDWRLHRVGLIVWLCSIAITVMQVLSVAHAGGFGSRQQSAYGQGTSFAGVAAGGSLSSMFWNPANLSDVDEFEVEANATIVLPATEVTLDPVPGLGVPGFDEGNIAHDEFVPSSYAAYRLTDRIVLGLAINSPFGLVSKYGGGSILNSTGVAGTSKVFTLNVNPAISIDVTDWLTVGAGAQIEYFDVRLSGQSLGPLGNSLLEGNDVGYGFTAGIRLMPVQGTEIGIGYRSFIDHKLDGTLKTSNAGNFDVGYDDVNLPDIVSLGIRQKSATGFVSWWVLNGGTGAV